MNQCKRCGEEIIFRTYEGRNIPIHVIGSCVHKPRYSEKGLQKAIRISCRVCKELCFLVEHNGGRVLLDSLGHPWPKHPCTYQILAPVTTDRSVVVASRADVQSLISKRNALRIERPAQSVCPHCQGPTGKRPLNHIRHCPMKHKAGSRRKTAAITGAG